MKTRTISPLTLLLLLLLISCSWAAASAAADHHQDFLHCLSEKFDSSNVVYTASNSSYTSILKYSIFNLRYASESTPKPQVIITPEHESQIPPVIRCAKKTGLEIRTRSGGHDFEGLSYVSQVPFVMIDLINLSEITVDAEAKTAWVEAGATIGSLYYRIAEKSPVLGFPAGGCLTIGVGGHFSGGGYGFMQRKYGLAADHVIDARIVDVNGRILDRKSMGEDLFWAIRGGGAASFGVVVAWKVELVDVPEKVTVFTVDRTLEQNATQLIDRWQYIAPNLDKDLFIGILITRSISGQEPNPNQTIHAYFFSLFLGGVDALLPLMQQTFPELGLARENCTEMSWIKSTLYVAGYPIETPLQTLLNRTKRQTALSKQKSDYVKKPIPQRAFQGIWDQFYRAEDKGALLIFMMPYGGRMAEISDSAIPFPHRAGNLYLFSHVVFWGEENARNSDGYLSWSRRLYDYMTPYVSTAPRSAYLNYRDLDLGVNDAVGETSYARAGVWGMKYFGSNFDRLVRVKTLVDPGNFFRNEQSIPPLHSKWKKGD
ncbi:tetrahydroberberine oxidase-like [Salvia miltiorrhiza]|uniref:tetrahydroberberine oxidase-like n=1 Tax=Salvia miltiorrhiza TaxID=226208 RepID=UPI0025AD5981|nr:tetrahydroberberine oxidase-like [Salvia miltiorrhiza]